MNFIGCEDKTRKLHVKNTRCVACLKGMYAEDNKLQK